LPSLATLEPVYSLDQDGAYSAITYLSHANSPTRNKRTPRNEACSAVNFLPSVLPSSLYCRCSPQPPNTKAKAVPAVSSNLEVTATVCRCDDAVEEVASDPTLYGTYVYERDKTLTGARQVTPLPLLGKTRPKERPSTKSWTIPCPSLLFRDAEDSGTVTVRYLVRAVNPATVSIRIDAVFIESARRAVHASDGAVESAEFGQVSNI